MGFPKSQWQPHPQNHSLEGRGSAVVTVAPVNHRVASVIRNEDFGFWTWFYHGLSYAVIEKRGQLRSASQSVLPRLAILLENEFKMSSENLSGSLWRLWRFPRHKTTIESNSRRYAYKRKPTYRRDMPIIVVVLSRPKLSSHSARRKMGKCYL